MAMRRSRIKAVANLSASRGRSTRKQLDRVEENSPQELQTAGYIAAGCKLQEKDQNEEASLRESPIKTVNVRSIETKASTFKLSGDGLPIDNFVSGVGTNANSSSQPFNNYNTINATLKTPASENLESSFSEHSSNSINVPASNKIVSSVEPSSPNHRDQQLDKDANQEIKTTKMLPSYSHTSDCSVIVPETLAFHYPEIQSNKNDSTCELGDCNQGFNLSEESNLIIIDSSDENSLNVIEDESPEMSPTPLVICEQKNVNTETNLPNVQNRLSRKRIKPLIRVSSVNRKERGGPKGAHSNVEDKLSQYLEQQTKEENIPVVQTNNKVTDISKAKHMKTETKENESDSVTTHESGMSASATSSSITSTFVVKSNEKVISSGIPKTLTQNKSTEPSTSSAESRLSLKHINRSICTSILNRNLKERPKGDNENIEEEKSIYLGQQTHTENDHKISTSSKVSEFDVGVPNKENGRPECNLNKDMDNTGIVQTSESGMSACRIDSSSKLAVAEGIENVVSAGSAKSAVGHAQNFISAETSSAPIQNRLSRKRIKPSICASSVNRKAKESTKLEYDNVETKTTEYLGQQTRTGNNLVLETDNKVAEINEGKDSAEEHKLTESTFKNNEDAKALSQLGALGISEYDINSCSKSTPVVNVSEDVPPVETFTSSMDLAQNDVSAETSSTPIQNRLSRKRIKPSICPSSVMRKAKERSKAEYDNVEANTTEYLGQQTHTGNNLVLETNNKGAEINEGKTSEEHKLTERAFKNNEDAKPLLQVGDLGISACDINSCSKSTPVVIVSEDVSSVETSPSSVDLAQIDVSAETSSTLLQNRLSRKRIKPSICASSVNRKAKERPKLEYDNVETKTTAYLGQQTRTENNLGLETNNKVAEINEGETAEEHKLTESTFKNNEDAKELSQLGALGISEYDINSCSKSTPVVNVSEDVPSVEIFTSSMDLAQNDVSAETSSTPIQNRLSRKRIKPSICASSVNGKVRERPKGAHENVAETPDCHGEKIDTKDIPGLQTNDKITDFEVGLSNEDVREAESSFKKGYERGHAHTHELGPSACDGKLSSKPPPVNEKVSSASLELSSSSLQNRFSRKRVKPSICAASVNREVRGRVTEVHDVDDEENSSVCLGQQTHSKTSPVLQKNIKVADLKLRLSAGKHSKTEENSKKIDDERGRIQLCDFGLAVCGLDRSIFNKPTPSAAAPLIKTAPKGIVPLKCSQSEKEPVNDSQDESEAEDHSPLKRVPKNDGGTVNLFRSRFIKPKPRILDSASRRSNRSVSVESATESDFDKKSLSSISTVSPPLKPHILGSRHRLNNKVPIEKVSERKVRRSDSNTDESDDNGGISDAPTEHFSQKRLEMSSDAESDFSQIESHQDVILQKTSPAKKKPRQGEYVRRLIEFKKEISTKLTDGRINKSRLTMFDLIYYNPVTNPMKSVIESSVTKIAEPKSNSSESEVRLAEESVDEPEAQPDVEDQPPSVPVPQVKVGPNGEIILDEQSLVIETTDAQKNWDDLQNSDVVMDYGIGTTTFNAFSKKKRTWVKFWNKKETLRFYRALNTVGTDFLLMQTLFPKLTRHELKTRFKKEERQNKDLVEKALRNPLPFDLATLQKEFEKEREEEENSPKPARKKPTYGSRRNTSFAAMLDATDRGKMRNKLPRPRIKKIKGEKTKKKRSKLPIVESSSESDSVPDNNTCANNEEPGNQKIAAVNNETVIECDSGEVANKQIVTATAEVEARRSGRTRRPKIFEDFMTDDFDDLYEDSEVTEICEKVTVKDICQTVTLEDAGNSDSESVDDRVKNNSEAPNVCENNVDGNNGNVPNSDSEEEQLEIDQNVTIAEEGLTLNESGVTLGNVYSNVKPGTLIVLATENPDNPGHKIFRVFMVSNDKQTVPVSVSNSETLVSCSNSTKGETSSAESPADATNDKVGCSNFKVS